MHPGLILRALHINREAASILVGISPQHMSELVNGNRRVTPYLAVLLSKSVGNTPAFWLKIQKSHDLSTTD